MPTHRLVQPPCRLKIYPAKAEVSRCEQEAYYLRDNNVFNDVKYIFNKASLLECFKTGYVDWDECLSCGIGPRVKMLFSEILYHILTRYRSKKQIDDSASRQILENVE